MWNYGRLASLVARWTASGKARSHAGRRRVSMDGRGGRSKQSVVGPVPTPDVCVSHALSLSPRADVDFLGPS